MRRVILAAAAALWAQQAGAADYLRGSTFEGPQPAHYRWSGWYFGAQVGYANTDFVMGTDATRDMVSNIVRALLVEQEANISHLPNLPNGSGQGMSYGGFVGYNAQWGDVVLGAELNYNRTSMASESDDVIGRSFVTSNNIRNDVFITSHASARLTDYGTLRLRAGYAMGWIMPYGMAGLAVARVNTHRFVRVQIQETDLNVDPPVPGGSLDVIDERRRNGAFTVGYMMGAGVDVGLSRNIFLRGEYEFVDLHRVQGISMRINTVRAAAGIKF